MKMPSGSTERRLPGPGEALFRRQPLRRPDVCRCITRQPPACRWSTMVPRTSTSTMPVLGVGDEFVLERCPRGISRHNRLDAEPAVRKVLERFQLRRQVS